jgi:hypothetical protein
MNRRKSFSLCSLRSFAAKDPLIEFHTKSPKHSDFNRRLQMVADIGIYLRLSETSVVKKSGSGGLFKV